MPGDKYGDGITLDQVHQASFPSLSIIVLTMNNNPAILSAVLILILKRSPSRVRQPICSGMLAALQKAKIHPGKRFRLLEKISA